MHMTFTKKWPDDERKRMIKTTFEGNNHIYRANISHILYNGINLVYRHGHYPF